MKKSKKYEYDYSTLRGRIIEKCGSMKRFAELLGQSNRTVSLKMQNEVRFSQDDIASSIEILELDEVRPYFFKLKVHKSELSKTH